MSTRKSVKLWDKGSRMDRRIELFTAGQDPELDRTLVPYDATASIAHAEMLAKLGILDEKEKRAIIRELEKIIDLHRQGRFVISAKDEDVHTAIENFLTRKLGDTGKKIHTFRSRNDQVLTALRLYSKEALADCRDLGKKLISSLQALGRKHAGIPLPGFTHTRKAMPSSVELWANAFVDSFRDDLALLKASWELIDQSPLGSGAGYGIPYPIDRAFTARRLGFDRVQENPIYVQNSRGKFEAHLLHILSLFLLDINKIASDLIFFSLPEFGFFELPERFLTGSSIMPHKKNPDVLELLRSRYHEVAARESEVKSLIANLISGYHRDFQQTKEPLFAAFRSTSQSLKIMNLTIKHLVVHPARCRKAMSEELYSVERAYRLVGQGVPFRDAYRRVAAEILSAKTKKLDKDRSANTI